jgi:hypothetical protein
MRTSRRVLIFWKLEESCKRGILADLPEVVRWEMNLEKEYRFGMQFGFAG